MKYLHKAFNRNFLFGLPAIENIHSLESNRTGFFSDSVRGESLEALSREVGVNIYRLEAWRDRASAGLELGWKDRKGEGHERIVAD